MVCKWVITPIYPIYRQVTTHLLTIDPNFLGHPSTGTLFFWGSRRYLFPPPWKWVWILSKVEARDYGVARYGMEAQL